ncbi:MAG: dTDP-4-dehydrorhamnose 3,5-epimerase family protein, partial [Paucibacter sp.]|nr:dTDP-4-dehydrorhamnose 3,5-epimerase family protein [Roseateles sp.]
PSHGKVASVELSEQNPGLVLIPRGVAHGFRALTDGAVMVYKTSSEHAPSHDCGVRWDSFGFDWHCPSAVLSDRDQGHPSLANLPAWF